MDVDLQDRRESIYNWIRACSLCRTIYKNIFFPLRGSISPLTGSGYALKPITPLLIIGHVVEGTLTGSECHGRIEVELQEGPRGAGFQRHHRRRSHEYVGPETNTTIKSVTGVPAGVTYFADGRASRCNVIWFRVSVWMGSSLTTSSSREKKKNQSKKK